MQDRKFKILDHSKRIGVSTALEKNRNSVTATFNHFQEMLVKDLLVDDLKE